jgi:hypothetical protein
VVQVWQLVSQKSGWCAGEGREGQGKGSGGGAEGWEGGGARRRCRLRHPGQGAFRGCSGGGPPHNFLNAEIGILNFSITASTSINRVKYKFPTILGRIVLETELIILDLGHILGWTAWISDWN